MTPALEPLHALGNGRGRHPDPPAELRHPQPPVGLELFEQAKVDRVEKVRFALYIVLAHRVARSPSAGRIDGLAAAMLAATVAITPVGGWAAAPALLDPVAVGAGIGVGVASSVIPYVLDQLAMARLSRATYSLMVSLLPASATVVGIVVLAQIPSRAETLGVALVVAAVASHREAADPA
jgi:inner membrane transporter RhtA